MADVKLSRPASGQQLVVSSAPDARLILDFPADQVSIDRPEGSSSLFFHFDDGASIELQNFYGAYNKEALPEFEIDGQLIAGTDFFEAFGPDLIPAAGPSAERGSRYNQYSDASLAEGLTEGIWHLNDLDYRLAFDGPQDNNEWTYGPIDNIASTLSTGGAPITLTGLKETGWDGAGGEAPGVDSVRGSFTVRDPDGDSLTAMVTIGGKTVAVSLGGPTTVDSEYGTLVITPTGGGSNVTFNFEYTLKQDPYSKTDQLAEGELYTDRIVISINDGMGHTVNQPINVVIEGSNDAPDITGVVSDLGGVDGHTVKDDGVFGSTGNKDAKAIGADERDSIDADTSPGIGDGEVRLSVRGTILAQDPDSDAVLTFGFVDKSDVALDKGSVLGTTPNGDAITVTDVTSSGTTLTITTDCGTLTLTTTGPGAGSYTFALDTDAAATNKLAEGQSVNLTLRPTVTDNHGATDGNAGVTRPDADGTSSAVNDLVITIKGSNDLPTVESSSWDGETEDARGTITEGDTGTIKGTIEGSDVDASEGGSLAYGFKDGNKMVETLYVVHKDSATGTPDYALVATLPEGFTNYYGTLTIEGSGESAGYTFTLNNGADCVQALDDRSSKTGSGPGWSSLEVKVPVVVMDDKGGYVEQDIHLTIKGTNDAPTFTLVENAAVKESGVYSKDFTGGETLYDSENKGTTDTGTGTGEHRDSVTGSVSATDVDGHGDSDKLTYGLDLGGSQFGATGGEADATIYVTATYDAETEEWTPTYHTSDQTGHDNYLGQLVMDKYGNYTFTLKDDGIANKIAEGDHIDLTFTPAVHDGTIYNANGTDSKSPTSDIPAIKITVKGSNEAPTITSDKKPFEITELSNSTASQAVSGQVTGADEDNGDTLSYHLTLGGAGTTLDGATLHDTLYVVSKLDADGKPVLTLSATSVPGKTYGTLEMVKDGDGAGTYTFTLNNDADIVQRMPKGQTLELSFNVAVVDNHGAYAHESVKLTINGANDAPVLVVGTNEISVTEAGVADGGNTTEAGTSSAEGTIVVTDVDSALAGNLYAIVGKDVTAVDGEGWTTKTTSYGTLRLNIETGKYKYTLNNEATATQALAQGKSHTDTINITVTDEHGGVLNTSINVEITGTNDKPTLTLADNTLSVTDQTNAAASSAATVTDPDDIVTGDKQTIKFGIMSNGVAEDAATTPEMSASVAGDYGTFSIDPKTGQYTYTIAKNNADVIALGKDDTPLTETFTVAVVDKYGAYSTKEVTVTINGADDPTVISTGDLNQHQDLIEAGVMPKSTVSDAQAREYTDGNAVKSTVTGRIYATDVDTKDQAELKNAPNETDTKLRYFIKVGTTEHDLNTLMGGKADGEAGTITLTYGSLTITRNDEGGFKYEYAVNNDNTDVQKMNLGDKANDDFTVLVKDADKTVSEAPVKITISGANDRPTIEVSHFKTDDQGNTIIGEKTKDIIQVGQVEVADFEQTDGVTQPVSKGFTFSLVDAPKHLTPGQIEGLKTDGTLIDGKADETLFNLNSDSPVMPGAYGRLTIDQATGKYTYERTADLTSLAEGSSVTDTFYVRVKDANGAYSEIKPIEITITGEDDAGWLTSNSLTVTEDGVTGNVQGILNWKNATEKLGANESVSSGEMSGALKWHDVDTNDTYKVIDPDKDDTYNSDRGYKYADALDVEVTSAATSGDAPAKPDITKADNVYTVEGYGKITVGADGKYSFTKDATDNAAFNALQAGQSITVTIPVTLKNTGTGKDIEQDLVITINGTNDAPVVRDDIAPVVETAGGTTDAAAAAQAWQAAFKDSAVWWSPSTSYDAFLASNEGAVFKKIVSDEATNVLNIIGWHYVSDLVDNDTRAFRDSNENWLFNSSFTAWRGELATLANGDFTNSLYIFVDGTLPNKFLLSDAALDLVKAYLPGSSSTLTGGIQIDAHDALWVDSPTDKPLTNYASDADNDHKLTFFAVDKDSNNGIADGSVVQAIEGKYGTLLIQRDGTYSYIVRREDEDYKKLEPGEKAQEHFEVYVRDEHNAVAEKPIDIVINLTKPVSGGGSGSMGLVEKDTATIDVTEDGTNFGSGSVRDNIAGNATNDLDLFLVDSTGENTSVMVTDYGTITLLPDGTYSYTLNNDSRAVQELTGNDTITQTFKVVNGNKDESTITVTITGTNDKPYEVGPGVGVAMTETVVVGTEGKPVVDDNGVTEKKWGASKEGSDQGSFTVNDWDKDEAAKLTPSGVSGDGTTEKPWTVEGKLGGTFTIIKVEGTDGEFTYTYKAPEGGTNYRGVVEDTAELTLSNNGGGDGNTVTVDLKAALTYANDAPVLTGEDGKILLDNASVQMVTEDTSMVATGTVKATDPDVTSSGAMDAASLSYAIVGSDTGMFDYMEGGEKLGTLIMGKGGEYEFHLNTSSEAVQALGAGEEMVVNFTIQVSDGNKGKATATLPIIITGTNDAPVISLHNTGGSGAAGSGALRYLTHGDFDEAYTVGGELKFKDVDANDTVTLTFKAQEADSVEVGGKPTLAIWAFQNTEGKWEQCAPGTEGAVKMGEMVLKEVTPNEDGSNGGSVAYNFVGNKANLALINKGETLDIKVSINADDGKGGETSAEFTVSITGTNSIPKITSSPVDANITDDGNPDDDEAYTASGKIVAADADAGDTLTYSIEGEGIELGADGKYIVKGYGTLTIDQYGSYKFELDDDGKKELAALGLDDDGKPETKPVGTFTIVVKDGVGARAEQQLSLSLTGKNDAPVVTITGDTLSATDVDGDALNFSVMGHALDSGSLATTEVTGAFGTLTFTADGTDTFSYKYELDTSYDNLTKLSTATVNADGKITDTFDYTVSDDPLVDGTSGSLEINIDVKNWDGKGGQLLFGDGDDGTMDGKITGGEGDDYLFGGDGDDHLFGGDGNDFLDGGDGTNHLFGGEGNDVLVFHTGDTIDGGAGFDMLVVREGSLNALFDTSGKIVDTVSNMEILVSSSGSLLNSLTSMSELAGKVGITISGDKVTMDDGWLKTTQGSGDDAWNVYTTTVNTGLVDEETVQVAILKSADV